MEYFMEYPSSDELETPEPVSLIEQSQLFSTTLDERLRRDEAFLTQSTEQQTSDPDRMHRAFDEKSLSAIETSRFEAQEEAPQKNAREQELLAEIGALRHEQRQRIEQANESSRRRCDGDTTPGTGSVDVPAHSPAEYAPSPN
jgi:hypothetical protein